MTRRFPYAYVALPILVLALLAAACGGPTTSPSASPETSSPPATTPTPDATDSPSASPTDGPSAAPSSPAPTDAEPPTGEPFTCDLPITDPGSVPIANIVDIRVGEHDDFDRFVFEFEQGTPAFSLERAQPPFTADASGEPIEVDGAAFLGLVMRGGTKQTDAGTSSYDGPTEFRPGFDTLVHAVEGGDFERQSTWYFGLDEEECVRAFVLDGPPRLVIDFED